MKTIVVFFLFFLPVIGFSSECVPNVNSCGYYLCQEKNHQCGPKGYPLGFGFKFCQIYLNSEKTYSAEAHGWLQRVRVCLMGAFEEADKAGPRTCGEVKRDSFHSHVGCYVETGFCDLSYADKLQIFWAMRSSIFHPEIYKDGSAVFMACATRNRPIR